MHLFIFPTHNLEIFDRKQSEIGIKRTSQVLPYIWQFWLKFWILIVFLPFRSWSRKCTHVSKPGQNQCIQWLVACLVLNYNWASGDFLNINKLQRELTEMQLLSLKRMRLKISSAQYRPFCWGPQCVRLIPRFCGQAAGCLAITHRAVTCQPRDIRWLWGYQDFEFNLPCYQ